MITPSAERTRDTLVIAIDFGTTFSGVAFAYSEAPDGIEVIKTWPGSKNLTSHKVPTEIAYDIHLPVKDELADSSAGSSTRLIEALGQDPSSDAAQAMRSRMRWGYEIPHDQARIQCIKLFLAKGQKLPSYISDSDNFTQMRKHRKSVDDVATDYLSALIGHLEMTLKKRFNDTMQHGLKKQYVLTVPAVWSDRAKQATLQAVERAGVKGEIHMISEPEAAARHTLRDHTAKWLKPGDHVVICDAGGGTVHLISYCIISTDPVMLKESTVGTGDVCGAALLNKRFELILKEALGIKDQTEPLPKTLERTFQHAMKHFETELKRNFASETEPDPIPCNGAADNEEVGLQGGYLSLTSKKVQDIFEPVIQAVINILSGQVKSLHANGLTVAAIMLVGGFGQSDYLYKRVKAHFDSDIIPAEYTLDDEGVKSESLNNKRKIDECEISSRTIEILQPMDAWTAVVQGAVLRGLEGAFVTERRSRYSYGTSSVDYYDIKQHLGHSRFLDRHEKRHMTQGLMQWFVKRGDTIESNAVFKLDFQQTWGGGKRLPIARLRVVENELFSSADDEVPRFFDPKGMRRVCTLPVDLMKVPDEHIVSKTNERGGKYWELNYQLEMKFFDSRMAFILKVGNKDYGRVYANYDPKNDMKTE